MWKKLLPATLLLAATSASSIESRTVEVPASIQEVFVPVGFDDNDNVELTLRIQYPNTCYREGEISKRIDHEKKKIHIKATSEYEDSVYCGLMLVFATETISLGRLDSGSYELVLDAKYKKQEVTRIEVAKANNEGPDDFNYLPISNVYLDHNDEQMLVLEGYYQIAEGVDQCYVVDEVELHEQDRILLVLPKARFESCEGLQGVRKVRVSVDVGDKLKDGKLIHVRSANGKSLNKILPYFLPH